MLRSGEHGVGRVASVAAGALLLHGCVTYTVEPTTDGARAQGARGSIAVPPARPGAVIAAPPGPSDPRTGQMAAELARLTGFGLVVASAFVRPPGGSTEPRHEMNRPLEGVPAKPASSEVATDEARQVYDAYERRVLEAARGRLTFYAEIHGNDRREAADRIEIATVGVDLHEASRLRTLLELCRDAHLRAHPRAPRLEARVEPADPIVDAASNARRVGSLRLPERALHIELPRVARQDWSEVYTAVLADFLVQAAALPAVR
jgi:hypothetical protein